MRKPYLIWTFFALLLVSVCSIFFGQYVLKGCFWWECAPGRSFNVLDLGLPAYLFPKGAIVDPISPPTDNHGEIEGAQQTIYIDHDTVVYDIYRYSRAKEAKSRFESDRKDMVDPQTGTEWKIPNDLTFSSTTADDLYIACGYFYTYRCEMAARYQEYAIFFGAVMNDRMTYAEFEKVVAYIDKQISSRLYP